MLNPHSSSLVSPSQQGIVLPLQHAVSVSISVLSTLYSKSETECLLCAAQRVMCRIEKVDIFDQRASLSLRVAVHALPVPVTSEGMILS